MSYVLVSKSSKQAVLERSKILELSLKGSQLYEWVEISKYLGELNARIKLEHKSNGWI
jgi:hypothetical protein